MNTTSQDCDGSLDDLLDDIKPACSEEEMVATEDIPDPPNNLPDNIIPDIPDDLPPPPPEHATPVGQV